jgi:glyoxylase-like metal-dependent hydrolase (beta-lactamase superfamily II)
MPLVRRFEALGGISLMFLTHRDDVADHRKFRDHFGCERVMHERDLGHGTRDIERPIGGDDPVALDSGLLVIPTPGHTRGSACLLYRDEFLFTGDHLAWSESRGHIYAFRSACWYDWPTLVRSSEKIAGYSFEWILPGHGRRCNFPMERMASEMARALRWMRDAA